MEMPVVEYASDHKFQDGRLQESSNTQTTKRPAAGGCFLSIETFDAIFIPAFKKTLKNISTDPFLQEDFQIQQLISHAQCCVEFEQCFHDIFCDVFVTLTPNLMSSVDREHTFKKLHSHRTDSVLEDKFYSYFSNDFSKDDVNTLVQVIFVELVGELFAQLGDISEKSSKLSSKAITDNDQSILFYIAGYIIRSLKKKYIKLKDRDSRLQCVGNFESVTSSSSFVTKYDSWYKIQNRGGLKKPCDDFFLLIREFENILRREVDMKHLCSTSLLTDKLREIIMESFLVKHYCDKLLHNVSVECATYVVEDVVKLFLTIRGHAVTRIERNKLAKQLKEKMQNSTKKSSSLRGSLKQQKI